MDTEQKSTDGRADFHLPLTVAVSERGENWPGKPTLWERFLNFLRTRRS